MASQPACCGVPRRCRCLRPVLFHPASLVQEEFSSSLLPFAAFVPQRLRARPPGCRASSSRAVHLTPPHAGRARVWLDAWAAEGGVFFLFISFFLSPLPSHNCVGLCVMLNSKVYAKWFYVREIELGGGVGSIKCNFTECRSSWELIV